MSTLLESRQTHIKFIITMSWVSIKVGLQKRFRNMIPKFQQVQKDFNKLFKILWRF